MTVDTELKTPSALYYGKKLEQYPTKAILESSTISDLLNSWKYDSPTQKLSKNKFKQLFAGGICFGMSFEYTAHRINTLSKHPFKHSKYPLGIHRGALGLKTYHLEVYEDHFEKAREIQTQYEQQNKGLLPTKVVKDFGVKIEEPMKWNGSHSIEMKFLSEVLSKLKAKLKNSMYLFAHCDSKGEDSHFSALQLKDHPLCFDPGYGMIYAENYKFETFSTMLNANISTLYPTHSFFSLVEVTS